MTRTIKNVIRTLRIHVGDPANLWAEGLYDICNVRNLVAHPSGRKKPNSCCLSWSRVLVNCEDFSEKYGHMFRARGVECWMHKRGLVFCCNVYRMIRFAPCLRTNRLFRRLTTALLGKRCLQWSNGRTLSRFPVASFKSPGGIIAVKLLLMM